MRTANNTTTEDLAPILFATAFRIRSVWPWKHPAQGDRVARAAERFGAIAAVHYLCVPGPSQLDGTGRRFVRRRQAEHRSKVGVGTGQAAGSDDWTGRYRDGLQLG